jgi:hypothetical protein
MTMKQTREHLAAVDEVLWTVWDPIGVNDIPEARDEYSCYAPQVLELLQSGASDEAIERHLASLARDDMALRRANPEHDRRTVAALRALSIR